MEIVKMVLAISAMLGCFSAIALGYIVPKSAVIYSLFALLFFSISIAASFENNFPKE